MAYSNIMQPLYLMNCYLKEFDSVIIDVQGIQIILENTAFYPESGGQPGDTGVLVNQDGKIFEVVSVKKINDQIVHIVSSDGLKKGDTIKGTINWNRRYQFMKYHTAAHILSTLIHNETGAQITGNQIKDAEARIDFSLENFDRDFMTSYEEKANLLIKKDLPIKLNILPRDEAFRIPSLVKLRKILPESIQEIRIVEIEGFDVQACGGTHIGNTSEIGKIKITNLENKGKDRKRIYFVLEQ
jgi:misacylated tRNA(Ala) deacylase